MEASETAVWVLYHMFFIYTKMATSKMYKRTYEGGKIDDFSEQFEVWCSLQPEFVEPPGVAPDRLDYEDDASYNAAVADFRTHVNAFKKYELQMRKQFITTWTLERECLFYYAFSFYSSETGRYS